jgi:hypothetical protein
MADETVMKNINGIIPDLALQSSVLFIARESCFIGARLEI